MKVKALKRFQYGRAHRTEIGQIINVDQWDAMHYEELGLVEIIKEEKPAKKRTTKELKATNTKTKGNASTSK